MHTVCSTAPCTQSSQVLNALGKESKLNVRCCLVRVGMGCSHTTLIG